MRTFATLSEAEKKELWACLALRHARGIGALRAKRLVEHYGSALDAVRSVLQDPKSWAAEKIVPPAVSREFASEKWRHAAREEWLAFQQCRCSVLLWSDSQYPSLLWQLPDAPLFLYVQGDISLLRLPSIGVVGSRTCTREGIAVAAFFARGLSRAGVSVVSGLARGIDRAAHVAGLEGVGKSIAVLGTGIDVVYPTCNADIAAAMQKDGLLLSEFAPGTLANSRHFPIRNRVISGLSLGVLVVEAAERSGSLITARLALEQGRDVFAVPGHTMAAISAGCRELIRSGAKAVFTADDILGELLPALTDAVRKELSRRLDERSRSKREGTEKPLTTADGAVIEPVLPENALPWMAEPAETRKKTLVAPAVAMHSDTFRPTAGGKIEPAACVPKETFSADEQKIVTALHDAPCHIDAICRRLEMDAADVSRLLLMLELRGVVSQRPGMVYALQNGRFS